MINENDINTWISGISLVVAIGALIAAMVSAAASKESATTAKETMIATKRPWVSLSDPEIIGFSSLSDYFASEPPAGPLRITPDKFQISCRLKNFGEGPAWIDEILFRFLLQKDPNNLSDKPDYTGSQSIPGWMIAPHEENPLTNITLDLSTGDMTKEKVQDLQRKKVLPMFFGHIQYHDQWQGKHETRFCWIFIDPLSSKGLRRFMLGGNKNWNVQT